MISRDAERPSDVCSCLIFTCRCVANPACKVSERASTLCLRACYERPARPFVITHTATITVLISAWRTITPVRQSQSHYRCLSPPSTPLPDCSTPHGATTVPGTAQHNTHNSTDAEADIGRHGGAGSACQRQQEVKGHDEYWYVSCFHFRFFFPFVLAA